MTNAPNPSWLSGVDLSKIARNPHRYLERPTLHFVAKPTELLDEAMNFIEEHPRLHQQGVWMEQVATLTLEMAETTDVPVCGSAGCLAGWGIAINNPVEGNQVVPIVGKVVLADQQHWVDVDAYAASLFGITGGQAESLFASHWTIPQLRAGVEEIKRNPQVGQEDLYNVMAAA